MLFYLIYPQHFKFLDFMYGGGGGGYSFQKSIFTIYPFLVMFISSFYLACIMNFMYDEMKN